MWNQCSGSGTKLPAVKIDGSGDLPITVELLQGRCPDPGCACGRISRFKDATGALTRAEIQLYTETSDGTPCDPSTRHVTLAHELGHAFGLANSSCSGYIMAPSSGLRTVKPDECSGAEMRWVTPTEEQEQMTDMDHPCSHQVP